MAEDTLGQVRDYLDVAGRLPPTRRARTESVTNRIRSFGSWRLGAVLIGRPRSFTCAIQQVFTARPPTWRGKGGDLLVGGHGPSDASGEASNWLANRAGLRPKRPSEGHLRRSASKVGLDSGCSWSPDCAVSTETSLISSLCGHSIPIDPSSLHTLLHIAKRSD